MELKAVGGKPEEFSAFPYLFKAITQHACVGSVTPRLKLIELILPPLIIISSIVKIFDLMLF